MCPSYHGIDFFEQQDATGRFVGSDIWTGTYSADGNTLSTLGMEDSDGNLTDGETLVINSDSDREQLDVAAGEVIGLDGANWRLEIKGATDDGGTIGPGGRVCYASYSGGSAPPKSNSKRLSELIVPWSEYVQIS